MKRIFLLVLVASAGLSAGCAHPQEFGVVSATASPTSSAQPVACATPNLSGANVIFVAASSDMTPATDSSGNSIFGFAPYPDFASGASAPQTSAVVAVTTSQVVQFLNAEPIGSSLSHSAVGFTTGIFPSVPYTFPSGSDTQIGTTITKAISPGSATPWSTGEIVAPSDSSTGTACASQVFTATTAGTFYFGDFDTYDSAASMRGEIVVSQ